MTTPRFPNVPIKESFGFTINRIAHGMRAILVKRLEPHNMTPEQWVLLYYLKDKDGITHAELAEEIFKDRAFVTRIVDHLNENGLVLREPNPADRRSSLVKLTDRGREIADELVKMAYASFGDMFEGISTEEYDEMMRILNIIKGNVEKLCSPGDFDCIHHK